MRLMTLLLLWFLMLCALAFAERCVQRLAFAVTALVASAATLLMIVGDLDRATILAALWATSIIGASKVKYHHSGIKLTVADLQLVFAGTIPFLLVQYRRVDFRKRAEKQAAWNHPIYFPVVAALVPAAYSVKRQVRPDASTT